jgi:hypothetical protein
MLRDVYSLLPPRLIFQTPAHWVELIASACSLLLALVVVGTLVRTYNKWHFLSFGQVGSTAVRGTR